MVLEQISALTTQCSEPERKFIERMILSAANYVQAVAEMETKALNFAGRPEQELRDAVSTADASRTRVHDSLITAVNVVNRICAAHKMDPIYTGDDLRRHYGDFAISLVQEIFQQRR